MVVLENVNMQSKWRKNAQFSLNYCTNSMKDKSNPSLKHYIEAIDSSQRFSKTRSRRTCLCVRPLGAWGSASTRRKPVCIDTSIACRYYTEFMKKSLAWQGLVL